MIQYLGSFLRGPFHFKEECTSEDHDTAGLSCPVTAPTTGVWSEELQSYVDRWVTLSIGRTAVIIGS